VWLGFFRLACFSAAAAGGSSGAFGPVPLVVLRVSSFLPLLRFACAPLRFRLSLPRRLCCVLCLSLPRSSSCPPGCLVVCALLRCARFLSCLPLRFRCLWCLPRWWLLAPFLWWCPVSLPSSSPLPVPPGVAAVLAALRAGFASLPPGGCFARLVVSSGQPARLVSASGAVLVPGPGAWSLPSRVLVPGCCSRLLCRLSLSPLFFSRPFFLCAPSVAL